MIIAGFILFNLIYKYKIEADFKNLAYGWKAMDCGGNHFHHLIDGIKDEKNIIPFAINCSKNAHVKITLPYLSVINYIIVYQGNGFDSKYKDQLRHFKVTLFNEQNGAYNFSHCATFGGETVDRVKLVLNCLPFLANMVMLTAYINRRLYINEIEVYSLEKTQGRVPMVYRGCFRNFNDFPGYPNIHISKCHTLCEESRIEVYYYFGITANSTCTCSTRNFHIAEESTSSLCHRKCWEDSEELCGGKGTSVYLFRFRLPVHLGCFKNSGSVDLYSLNTVPECFNKCNNTYVGLTGGGQGCFCSMNEPKEEVDPKYCTMKCSKQHAFCGGDQVSSVYLNCKMSHLVGKNLSCSELFHCKEYDESGQCQTPCYEGYIGSRCMNRALNITNCAVFNTCTGLKKCVDNVLEDSYKCVCQKGYEEIDGNCRDVDECVAKDHRCKENSRCQNSQGSYTCKCKEGYKNKDTDSTICEKINVCILNICDNETTICYERDNIFRCNCKPGFDRENQYKCKDVDECMKRRRCGEAVCNNKPGSYTCDCGPGRSTFMIGATVICSDMNECLKENICGPDLLCINTEGSYECICEECDSFSPDNMTDNLDILKKQESTTELGTIMLMVEGDKVPKDFTDLRIYGMLFLLTIVVSSAIAAFVIKYREPKATPASTRRNTVSTKDTSDKDESEEKDVINELESE